jgi:hypothetical protein
MELAPLVTDTTISANWIIAGMMALLIFMIKRSNDRADIRERKIDEILEAQQKQISEHEKTLLAHQFRIENHDDIYERNERVYREIMLKLGKV